MRAFVAAARLKYPWESSEFAESFVATRVAGRRRGRRAPCKSSGRHVEALEPRQLLSATVSMNLSNPLVVDGSGNSANFVILRSSNSGSLEVFYRVGGSAPSTLFSQTFSGETTFANGQSSITLSATPLTQAAGPDLTLTLAITTPENCGYTLGSVNQATMLAENPSNNEKDVFVGPSQTYSTVGAAVSAATAGEFIDVLSTGAYSDDTATVNVNGLTIRGVGNGYASMVWNTSQQIPNEKGIIVQATGGSNLTVQNMDLEGARISAANGNNAAGIRAQGDNLTVTNCRIYNNQDGILNGDGVVLVDYCDFSNNGTDGQSHELYFSQAVTTLTFEYNYVSDYGVVGFTGTNAGHLFKSRAGVNYVLYNDFDDGSSPASYEVSFPNGGQDTVIGNTIIQGPNSANDAIIDYSSESTPGTDPFLYLVNNTVINDLNNSSAVFVSAGGLSGFLPANFNLTSENNIFAGPGKTYSLTGGTTAPMVNSGNYVNSSVSGVGFVNASSGDYHLLPTSGAIGVGVSVGSNPNGLSLTPVDEYVSTADYRLRDASSDLDAGAFGAVTMQGRYVFYNDSYYDGDSTAASTADFSAIATDKSALLPGQTATFANYTSYSNGLNGVIVDIKDLAYGSDLTAADFTFLVGNNSTPSGWAAAPAPASIAVFAGDGTNGSTRVEIIWANNAIQDQWLQVTVLADAVTGLTAPDVFYFGNAIGETGNNPGNAQVDVSDELLARDNFTGLGTASITNDYDFNRDGYVNVIDELIARSNFSGLSPLLLISAPATPATDLALAASLASGSLPSKPAASSSIAKGASKPAILLTATLPTSTSGKKSNSLFESAVFDDFLR